MTDNEENQPKKTLGERVREVFEDVLEVLEELVNPVPAPRPIPIRHRPFPRRR